LSRNCGTGTRYIEDVYYHHESESEKMWETLQQNRRFHNKVDSHRDDLLLEMEDALSQIDMDE